MVYFRLVTSRVPFDARKGPAFLDDLFLPFPPVRPYADAARFHGDGRRLGGR